LLYLPARHVIERGGTECLAGAKAEAGVVPGAPYRVSHDEPFGEWAAVMAAHGADGKPLLSLMDQEHRLPSSVARQHSSIGDLNDRDARLEVRPGQRCVFAHIPSVEVKISLTT
jgi:hypothetical protein